METHKAGLNRSTSATTGLYLSRILHGADILEKLTVPQPVNMFPACYDGDLLPTQNSPAFVHIPRSISYTPLQPISKIHFNIIHLPSPMFPKWSLLQVSLPENTPVTVTSNGQTQRRTHHPQQRKMTAPLPIVQHFRRSIQSH
jgi:hypothetical protein